MVPGRFARAIGFAHGGQQPGTGPVLAIEPSVGGNNPLPRLHTVPLQTLTNSLDRLFGRTGLSLHPGRARPSTHGPAHA
jgi:hypothetical protein